MSEHINPPSELLLKVLKACPLIVDGYWALTWNAETEGWELVAPDGEGVRDGEILSEPAIRGHVTALCDERGIQREAPGDYDCGYSRWAYLNDDGEVVDGFASRLDAELPALAAELEGDHANA